MKELIRVLVIDDSAVVRQLFTALLTRAAGFEVESAADVALARRKMRDHRPDVLVLDIELPNIDGLTFLRELMKTEPLPVVICSAYAGSGTLNAIRALELGAVAIVDKPKIGVKDFLQSSSLRLIETIRSAAGVHRFRHFEPVRLIPAEPRLDGAISERVVAVGTSTGGTEALHCLLGGMWPGCPGLLIVIHMPPVFTAAFASRLDSVCPIRVKEAEQGDTVLQGTALIAPGDRHLKLVERGGELRVQLTGGPAVSHHRPSVDVLFESVAVAAGPKSMGIIMTGMGEDGAAGLLRMRARGAYTVAQDESTCVVFGMPKQAIEIGAAQSVLALDAIAPSVRTWSTR